MELINWIILVMIYYCVWFAISVPVHEFGHLVCGWLTGHKFSSFKILYWIWVKEGNKVRLKYSRNNLLLGQCLMVPPENEKDFKFFWYNFGGSLFNFLTCFIALGIGVFNETLFSPFIFSAVIWNLIMGLANILPMNLAIPNDGQNILTALKSDAAKHGLYMMLRTNTESSTGKRFRDFSPDVFKINCDADYENYFVVHLVICEASRQYDIGNHKGAIEIYDTLSLENIQPYYRNCILLEYLYYYIVHEPDKQKAMEIYEDKKVRQLLNIGTPSTLRILASYEFFIKKYATSGRKNLEKARKENAKFPNLGIQLMEDDYLDALENLMNIHDNNTLNC